MAIFEKHYSNNVELDDTELLTCVIENSHFINKHTEYSIKVQRGPLKIKSWNVSHRYNDFATLHSSLQLSGIPLPLPPKKLIGNTQPGFIAERQSALQIYLNEILKNNILASSFPVKIFLDPHNYSRDIREQALQNVSMALRGGGDYELKAALHSIGWRIRKHYYEVNGCHSPSERLMLGWSTYGPDKLMSEKDMQVTFKSLMNIECPYVDKIILMHSLETGAYTIRNIYSSGTVRDILYGTSYNKPYLIKYAAPNQKNPFSTGQIAKYGYQILKALKFLHDAGLPYGHLHPGNIVIIDKNYIKLLDIENSIIGVPCFYRHHLVNHKKINSMQAVDVYSYGHTLYEMIFAEPLTTSTCEMYPDGAPPVLVSLLESILSPQSCKRGMPTVDCLLEHPLFDGVALPQDLSRCKLKFTPYIKEELQKVSKHIESRLKLDQRVVRTERRQHKIQEILSSEEELRKRKKKMKIKESVFSANSPLANGSSHTENGLSPINMSGPSERSGSVASTLSTSSTPTPPQLLDASSSTKLPVVQDSGRSALLDSICSFNKSKLNKINK